jgi:hypothetical protein
MYKLVAFMIIVYLVFLAGAGWWVSKELAPLTKTHPECVSEACA